MRKADRKDLIRTNGSVLIVAVNRVIKTTRLFIPEPLVEARARALGQFSVSHTIRFIAKLCGQFPHDTERVVPERLNLYSKPAPRRHDPITDLRIHPGQLHSLLA